MTHMRVSSNKEPKSQEASPLKVKYKREKVQRSEEDMERKRKELKKDKRVQLEHRPQRTQGLKQAL